MDIKVLRKLSLRKGDKIRVKDALSLVNEKLDMSLSRRYVVIVNGRKNVCFS